MAGVDEQGPLPVLDREPAHCGARTGVRAEAVLVAEESVRARTREPAGRTRRHQPVVYAGGYSPRTSGRGAERRVRCSGGTGTEMEREV
ncbi:hypothetical protein [Streptomyces wuyuanensis]|uniref:hypothetical protein n=1 Tax=Streptomyces wuyuanensis TaxID=1196353 RepID=UPI003435AC73